jgi:uncharacterized protein
MSWGRVIGVLLCLAVLLPCVATALEVPTLKGRVNDYGAMLPPESESRIETLLKDLEEKDSTQVVVLTVPSLAGDSLEDFSMRVAERWKIGRKGLDNGAILVIARDDRKVRIEVGYGLEGRLTDITAGRIIRDRIVPEFRAGRFDQGVLNGVVAVAEVVRGEFEASGQPPAASGAKDLMPFLLIFVFMVFTMGRASRLLGAAGGGFLMPFLGHMAFAPGPLVLVGLGGLGLIAGYILALIAGATSSMGPRSSGRGGFPIGFPRGGGGFSTGGGGFSGGGGGFGGGGASGSW